ncbi:MAG: LacI family DNA-binding transcriptional regulator [Xanthobacteraceae bacterium]|nr:LacI family DNA-binding transcriptional regulator [Xanthobacteraceae bacterium]
MASKRVTSHDVARRAGVSRTTVSLVLNRSEAVALSPETRERVRAAATELGYRPNSAGRMLVSGSTETIGLIISDAAILPIDGFIPQVLHGIGHVNRERGLHVLLEGRDSSSGPNPYEALVDARRIDGLIVLNPRGDDEPLKALIESEFPVVLVGSIRHPQEHSVNFSSRAGISAATRLLVELGHRRIGMVAFAPPNFVAADTRISAVRRALATFGLTMPDEAVDNADFSAESGYHATKRLLQRRPDLTAIFAGNDTIAIGVMSAAAALGRRVPDDLSVIGFDDLPFSAWLSPALTTVHIDAVQQGALAAEMLIRLLAGEAVIERQVRLDCALVERKSCAAAPRTPLPKGEGQG